MAAVAALGPPGIWCHGLAIKPGRPTTLAEAGEAIAEHAGPTDTA